MENRMYGNAPFASDPEDDALTPEQRESLRRDLTAIAARTRELLPGEYVVGAQIAESATGPRGRIAVQPPRGSVVSADYTPTEDVAISEEEQTELVRGLAASAALQEMQAHRDDDAPPAG